MDRFGALGQRCPNAQASLKVKRARNESTACLSRNDAIENQELQHQAKVVSPKLAA
jgi:hypothetical protein